MRQQYRLWKLLFLQWERRYLLFILERSSQRTDASPAATLSYTTVRDRPIQGQFAASHEWECGPCCLSSLQEDVEAWMTRGDYGGH